MIDLKYQTEKILKLILVLLFFVSPLLFFTNLTRNPYFFQITIINISIAIYMIVILIEVLKRDFVSLRFGPIHYIFFALLFIFFISSVYGYFGHLDFYKKSIINENKKMWFYTIVNAFLPFFIVSQMKDYGEKKFPFSISFIILWGGTWLFFKLLKISHPFFDIYGIIVWLFGIWYVYRKSKFSIDYLIHIAMLSGFFASVYGILQYFGIEIIWDKNLTPYGRRAVTTFGNPNFASSYMLMLIPFTIYYYTMLKDKARYIYLLFFSSFVLMIFASLTRSSIIGMFLEFAFLVLWNIKKKAIPSKDIKKLFYILLFMMFLWPDQNLKPLSFGVINRLSEAFKKTTQNPSITASSYQLYQSFHQRLLIWRCGIDMFLENPITGKGWGNFELFFPFYQANYLRLNPSLGVLRTHANNAHNEIIEILSQTGLLGFGISFLFFISIFSNTFHSAFKNKNFFHLTLLLSIIGMISDNLLNVSIHFAVPGLLFFSIIGIIGKEFSTITSIETKRIRMLVYILLLLSASYIYIWINYFLREIYYFSGFKEMRLNNYSKAVILLEKAFRFHKWEVNNDYELANAYVKTSNLQKGVETYKYALGSNAGYDEIYFNLAIVEKTLGNYEDAIKNIRTSIWINPLNEKAYYAYAELAIKTRIDNNEAISILTDGLNLHLEDAYLNYLCGYFYEENQDINKAKSFYEKAVYYEPTNVLYTDKLRFLDPKNMAIKFADLYKEVLVDNKYDVRNVEKMINEFEPMLSSYKRFQLMKAKIYYDKKDYDSAIKTLLKLIEKDPSFQIAFKSLGIIYESIKNYDKAIYYYTQYFSNNPNDKQIALRIENLKRLK